jgi:hypothetical protein
MYSWGTCHSLLHSVYPFTPLPSEPSSSYIFLFTVFRFYFVTFLCHLFFRTMWSPHHWTVPHSSARQSPPTQPSDHQTSHTFAMNTALQRLPRCWKTFNSYHDLSLNADNMSFLHGWQLCNTTCWSSLSVSFVFTKLDMISVLLWTEKEIVMSNFKVLTLRQWF